MDLPELIENYGYWVVFGRTHGAKLLARFPKYASRAARAQELLVKYDTPIILAVRFLYGLRIVLPFTIGMSRIPTLRFQLLNFAGAVLWASSGAVAPRSRRNRWNSPR